MAANRLAHGYRWEDERWKDEPLLANGSFGSMGGMLTSVRDLSRYVGDVPVGVAAARRSGDRADPAVVAARDAAPVVAGALVGRRAIARPARCSSTSGGYGYGLRVSQNCTFRTIVSHTGGLPGFGSVDDLAARLRHRHRRVRQPDVHRLERHRDERARGAGRRRRTCIRAQPTPSPALTDARDKVSRLVASWDDRLADSIAAENLFLDQSKDRRRAEIERLRAAVGACTPGQRLRHRRERAARVVDDELRDEGSSRCRSRWRRRCRRRCSS